MYKSVHLTKIFFHALQSTKFQNYLNKFQYHAIGGVATAKISITY